MRYTHTCLWMAPVRGLCVAEALAWAQVGVGHAGGCPSHWAGWCLLWDVGSAHSRQSWGHGTAGMGVSAPRDTGLHCYGPPALLLDSSFLFSLKYWGKGTATSTMTPLPALLFPSTRRQQG